MKRISCCHWGFIVVAGGLTLCVASTRAADENLKPVAHWSFEDHDAGVIDKVGKHNGTVMGAPMPAPGVAGKALRFDGRSDVVIVPASPALSVAQTAFTAAAWVNPYAFNRGQQMIVAKNVYSANQREWGLMIDKDDRFRFYLWQGGWKTVGAQTELQSGHWHHVAVTVEKGHGRLYVNGKLAGEGPLAPSVSPTDAPLTIGGVQDGARLMQTFRGALDEVSLYREVLTPATIRTLADVRTPPHTLFWNKA